MSESHLRVAVIGFGNHVQKNMLSHFAPETGRKIGAIYVRDVPKYRHRYPQHAKLFTDRFDAILADRAIPVIYIASPISTHYKYAHASLSAGKHVWCEKPLTDNLSRTRKLTSLAKRKFLFLAEVSMYQHHRQFTWIQAEMQRRQESGQRFLGARARFSIPALDISDIRYSKKMGGGALLDVGYYPLSMAVALFGRPKEVLACGYGESRFEVDLNGTALLVYSAHSYNCSWAIGSSYSNEIELDFSESRLYVQRAFSKPSDFVTEVQVTGIFGTPEERITIGADDQFKNMLDNFTKIVVSSDLRSYPQYSTLCLNNAELLESVRSMIDMTSFCNTKEQ